MQKKATYFLFLLLPNLLFAQLFPNLGGQRAGISAFSFLKMDINTRSAAMGGANVCLQGDAFSSASNPATLADVKNVSFGLSNAFWYSGINYSYLTGVKPTKVGNFALSMSYLNSGAMPVRTEFQPDGTGEYFYANYYTAGFTYARQLTDYFSYGASAKFVHEQLAQMSASTATIDLGFLYRTDYKDLSFAVNMQNFGFNSKIAGTIIKDTVFNNKPFSIDNYPPPTVFQLGISMIPFKKDDQSLTVAVQLNHPNDNAENIRLGMEYQFKSLLYARLGYKINVKDQHYPTAGLGLRMRMGKHPLKFDYAVEPMKNLGLVHRVGLALELNTEKRQ